MQATPRRKIRSKKIDELELRYQEPIIDLLRHLYYDQGLTQLQIAERLDVPAGTIATWMIGLGINQRAYAARAAQERSRSEARQDSPPLSL